MEVDGCTLAGGSDDIGSSLVPVPLLVAACSAQRMVR